MLRRTLVPVQPTRPDKELARLVSAVNVWLELHGRRKGAPEAEVNTAWFELSAALDAAKRKVEK